MKSSDRPRPAGAWEAPAPFGKWRANRPGKIFCAEGFPVGRAKVCRYSFQTVPLPATPAWSRWMMLRQTNSESGEVLGDWHPLVHQLGAADGLIALSTASHSLQL